MAIRLTPLVVLGAALCLAACTSSADPDPPTTGAAVSASAVPTSAAAPSASAPASAAPTASAAASAPAVLPAAADGKRLPACRDGRCEVIVSAKKSIELSGSLGLYAVAVYQVKGNEIGLFASLRGGGKFSCDGDEECQVSVQGASGQYPASAQFTAHPGARIEVAKLRIQVVAVVNKQAVLRLTRSK